MPEIIIEALNRTPVDQQRVELVERKGIGHPDPMRSWRRSRAVCDKARLERNIPGKEFSYRPAIFAQPPGALHPIVSARDPL
jgi:hypothetical protein